MTFAEETSDNSFYTIEVDEGDASPGIVIKESSLFGETCMTLTAENAERIAYSLLRAVNSLKRLEIEADEPLKLVASL